MSDNLLIKNTARGLAVKILDRIDKTDAYFEKLIDSEFRHSNLSSQDKALLNEIVHGVIRWQGRLDYILAGFFHGDFYKAASLLRNNLRCALYQILFLDNIPHHAAVNEAVEYIKQVQGDKVGNLVNGVLRNIIRSLDKIRYPDREEDLTAYLSVYYSHPQWIVKKWLNRYGPDFTEKLLNENNERPKITLRYNSLLTDRATFITKLKEANLKFYESVNSDRFFILQNLSNITEWSYFKEGYFSVQDESAGLPCILLDPKPGEEILDLCSAPGGKTAFISELMNNEGKIYAVDKYGPRINVLKKNIERLKISIVDFIEADAEKLEFHLVDKILIDAPCSGLGVLKKKPDIKWKRDSQDILQLQETQLSLLENAKRFLKVGGTLVYSTCTIEPEENIEVIKKFLSTNKNFSISEPISTIPPEFIDQNGFIVTFPHIHKMDGSFAAKILRNF